MGEAADLLLEGILDEQTGEYIGDRNRRLFGEEAPGFPVSYQSHPYIAAKKEPCPVCGKLIVVGGPPLQQHMKAKHGE